MCGIAVFIPSLRPLEIGVNKTYYQTTPGLINLQHKRTAIVVSFVSRACLAERDSKNAGFSFFLCVCVCTRLNNRACSQAFLVETIETGHKNRHEFH